MSQEKVSIIVTIYNVEKYLRECLNSLERQTFKDIEVILVNDGSTDNSMNIAREYCNNNEHYSLINRENGGLSAARNTGIDLAHGEYIYFLDGDDYVAEDAIEKLYKKSKEENLDQLRFTAYKFKDGTSGFSWTKGDTIGGYKYSGDYPVVMKGVDFYRRTIENNDFYPSCCLIFTRRAVIEKNNLRFFEGIIHEDILFNFQLTSLCDRVALLHEPLYYRRVRDDSITMEYNWMKIIKAMCISAVETDKFIDSHLEIKDAYGTWQVAYFINMMLSRWEQMNKDEQESFEAKEYFLVVKSLVKKYGLGGIPLKLFYKSYSLYRLYSTIRTTVGKILHGNK